MAALHVVHSLGKSAGGALTLQGKKSIDALKAQEDARIIVQDIPGDARMQYLFGLASLNAGDGNSAVLAFKRALELGVDCYLGYQGLGAAYQRLEEPRLAVAAWKSSGDLRPALAWGNGLLLPGGTNKARAIFEAMIENGGNLYYRSEGYYRSGIAWGIDGRWDLALVNLERAYQLRPAHPPTLVDLARALYYTGGDRQRAEALIATAYALQPENEWIAAILTELYTKVGAIGQATRWRYRLEDLRSRARTGR